MEAKYYRSGLPGMVRVRFPGVYPRANELMHHIGAKYDGASRCWTFDAAFLPLVREEVEQITGELPKWCPAWPLSMNDLSVQFTSRCTRVRYKDFPRTAEAARQLAELRSRHQADRQAQA